MTNSGVGQRQRGQQAKLMSRPTCFGRLGNLQQSCHGRLETRSRFLFEDGLVSYVAAIEITFGFTCLQTSGPQPGYLAASDGN